MGLRLRYSAWTLPWLLDFKQKVASIPTIPGSGTGQVDGGFLTTGGRSGVMVNLSRFGRIDSVIADDEGSLIRVYDGATIIDEFIAKRGSRSISDKARTFPLSGSALSSIFDQYLVPAFDAPANPPTQPNWQWGSENILGNPGFEDPSGTSTVYELVITATGGTYTLSDGVNTTSAIAFDALAGTINTRIQTDLALLPDVVVTAAGSSPRKFIITMVDPPFGVPLTVDDSSLTGGDATIVISTEGGLSFSPWTNAKSLGGTAGGYTHFNVSSDHAQTGTHSLKIDAGPSTATSNRWPGAQQIVNVAPGIYQASLWVYPTNGTDTFQFRILSIGEELIAYSANSTLTANTWNQITISDIVIPEGTTQVIFRIQCTNPGPSDPAPFYIDDAELYPGLPATDAGEIVTALFDAHSEIGNWIDYSSISGTDSNGDAYPEDISFEVQWGEHYGHVLDRHVDLKYEWELVPKVTPVGTLTHDFHLYIPGGRDATYVNSGVPTAALNKGQSITDGEVIKRIPDYTSVLLEGAGGAWSKVTDATAEAQFGVLEKFVANRQLLNETTRVLAAEQVLAYEEANRRAVRLEVTRSLFHPRPGIDYRPGDSIPFQIPPALPKESRRVQRIDYTNTFPTTYVVTGSRVLDGEAAAYDLIWRLWRRFSRPPVVEPSAAIVSGGKGGAFTIQVSAFNATQWSKDKADMQVTIQNGDTPVINTAVEELPPGGTLWLSEGDFYWDLDDITVKGDIHIRGMGPPDATVIHRISSASSGALLTVEDDVVISDLTLDGYDGCGASGVGIAGPGADNVTLRNVYLTNFDKAIEYGGDNWQLENVRTHLTPICVEATAGHSQFRMHGCRTAGLIDLTDVQDITLGGDCILGSLIELGAAQNVNIEDGITFLNPGGAGLSLIHADGANGLKVGDVQAYDGDGYFAVTLENVTDFKLSGGMYGNITRGYYIDTCTNGVIEGYHLGAVYLGEHGIQIIDSNVIDIYPGLILTPGQDLNNTYDGVIVTGGSGVRVFGPRVHSAASVSPQPRYGVNMVSGSGHVYVASQVAPAANFASGQYSNAAGAANSWPAAGGAQGDNFA